MVPPEDWLADAQRLPIGGRRRVRHNEEPSAAMVVGNDPDCWWCHCHRCGTGGRVQKDHVLLGVPEVQPRVMAWPADALPATASRLYRSAYGLLLQKGIDASRDLAGLPLYITERDRRLLIPTSLGWVGRALANQQPKWVSYGCAPPVYGLHPHDNPAPGTVWVLTEDLLSAYKVRRAVPEYTAVACLGTRLSTKLLERMLGSIFVIIAFDGDAAGRSGAAKVAHRLRGLGLSCRIADTPEGLDPKDLWVSDIRKLIGVDHA